MHVELKWTLRIQLSIVQRHLRVMERQMMLRLGVYGCVLGLILRCVDQFQYLQREDFEQEIDWPFYLSKRFCIDKVENRWWKYILFWFWLGTGSSVLWEVDHRWLRNIGRLVQVLCHHVCFCTSICWEPPWVWLNVLGFIFGDKHWNEVHLQQTTTNCLGRSQPDWSVPSSEWKRLDFVL